MWWFFGRKGPSGFSYYSTAEEVTQGIDGSGLTAIVTGGTSGLGAETTRVLALRGVHVIMACRNVSIGEIIRDAILEDLPEAMIDVSELSLRSMASVRKFASDFISSGRPLNILINNAGIRTPFKLSKDDIELQFTANHLGHFLLTNLLLDTMKKTSSKTKQEGRIVNVSSNAYKVTYPGGIRFDQINDEAGYSSMRSYGQSKLANILHANELARRLKEGGYDITANSVHPGTIPTNLIRDNNIVSAIYKYVKKNVQQGAATTCYVALHSQVKGISGEYFVDSNLGKATGHASDVALAKKLWDFSWNLIK